MKFSIQLITAATVASLTLAAGVAIAQTTPMPATQQDSTTGTTGNTSNTLPGTTNRTDSTTGSTGTTGNTGSNASGTLNTQGGMGASGNTGLGTNRTDTTLSDGSRTDMAFTDRAARADRN